MAVAIVGMHRSATSMVAGLLHDLGLHLGPADELMPAGPENADGYWENLRLVAVNESLLGAVGAGWDYPPASLDPRDPALVLPRAHAAAVVRELAAHAHWGWKDPRTTVTLEFWLDLVPDLLVVGCVRNPLEVALSLRHRNDFSYEHGLALWLTYNERLLASAPADRLLLTHYDAYFADPVSELRRVGAFCGLDPNPLALESALPRCRRALRHNRFAFADVVAAGVSRQVLDLYRTLCDRAGWDDGQHDVAVDVARHGDSRPAQVDRRILDVETLRRSVGDLHGARELLRRELEDARLEPPHPTGHALGDDLAALREAIERQNLLLARAVETPAPEPPPDPEPEAEPEPELPPAATADPAPEADREAVPAQETLRRRVAFREFREPPPARADTPAEAVSLVLDELEDRRVEHPAVLNLSAERHLLDDPRRAVVFSPPVRGADLPYLDASVDVVVVDEQDDRQLEEARRVAARALIVNGGAAGALVEWLEEAGDAYPSASIVIHSADSVADARTRATLLAKSLPSSLDAEFVIADDAPAGDLAVATHAISGSTRVRTVRGLGGIGFGQRCTAAARSAEGDILVFLNAHLTLEPDWLRPLVRAFAADAAVGAVGGKLVADGRIVEAGRVLFSDGTSVGFGAGTDELGAPLFNFTRDVDGCSLDLLATRRDVFVELGGFDDETIEGYRSLDYCLRLWQSGRRVLFEPSCVGVYAPDASPSGGLVPPPGWVKKWSDDLERHPPRPSELDASAWHRLAVRTSSEGVTR